jgi:hypothetical protein
MALPDLGCLALCAEGMVGEEEQDGPIDGFIERTRYPTGMLGPVVHHALDQPPSSLLPYAQQSTNPAAPRAADNGRLDWHAGRRLLRLTTSHDSISVKGAQADGASYNGVYTGEMFKGLPEGSGTLVVDTSAQFSDYTERGPSAPWSIKTFADAFFAEPGKLTIDGTWYKGQLVDGQVKATDSNRALQTTMKASMIIKDKRPFGDTDHQVSLRQEMRSGYYNNLLNEIYVENAERVVSWAGMVVTMTLSGRILWSSRPTAHKFPWALEYEKVELLDGTGTLSVDLNQHDLTNNPVLTGRAKVGMFVRNDQSTDQPKRILLVGNMVDNRLQGVVLAAEPIPGVKFYGGDYRFFIEGYSYNGAPIVRMLTVDEKKANPLPRYPEGWWKGGWYANQKWEEAFKVGIAVIVLLTLADKLVEHQEALDKQRKRQEEEADKQYAVRMQNENNREVYWRGELAFSHRVTAHVDRMISSANYEKAWDYLVNYQWQVERFHGHEPITPSQEAVRIQILGGIEAQKAALWPKVRLKFLVAGPSTIAPSGLGQGTERQLFDVRLQVATRGGWKRVRI